MNIEQQILLSKKPLKNQRLVLLQRFINGLVVARNLWLILLSKILLFTKSIEFYGFSICAHFSLASVVAELLAIFLFFTKSKFQNTHGPIASTW
jgi:hypothetical protein